MAHPQGTLEDAALVERALVALIEIEVGQVPPSLNRVATRGSRFKVSRAKKSLQEELVWALLAAKVPKGLTRVEASASLRFPQRRRRDPGNYGWLIEKSLGDALAPHDPEHPHRWLPDDTAAFFAYGPTVIEEEPGPARTTIILNLQRESADAAA